MTKFLNVLPSPSTKTMGLQTQETENQCLES